MTKYFVIAILLMLIGCRSNQENKLPILGEKEVVNGDTVYHTIPDFSFINQDSQVITNKTFENQLYVVDFFFTSCPTICPKVTRQMLRI
ncbi:MAG: SCO family protein, partial [Saprospiraceae bacterium]